MNAAKRSTYSFCTNNLKRFTILSSDHKETIWLSVLSHLDALHPVNFILYVMAHKMQLSECDCFQLLKDTYISWQCTANIVYRVVVHSCTQQSKLPYTLCKIHLYFWRVWFLRDESDTQCLLYLRL